MRIQDPGAFTVTYFLRPVIKPVHVLFHPDHGSYTVFSILPGFPVFTILSIFTVLSPGFHPGIHRADPPVTVHTDTRGLAVLPVYPSRFHASVLITYPPVTVIPDPGGVTRFPVLTVINSYRRVYLEIDLVTDLDAVLGHDRHVGYIVVTLQHVHDHFHRFDVRVHFLALLFQGG